ncbi:Bug family tripartite tricarboxylate transporter substrate binding protein [Jiella sonneratiae]|uniref:Tripartite tricarboxylate transporter substrate binding protein n=1 Tax=Jiella sonneratiae TaxID=2816856 RepID=A0ABS3J8U3_9HYPH|nr:tripartite tricarboxylate transporter substrate-binding protein [Jiella sonneratiae]MBO0906092.1 hypothetical protein [Jiella sonneratiae]
MKITTSAARRLAVSCLAVGCWAFGPAAAKAESVADFYDGETVTLVSGFSASGENDTYFRLWGANLGSFIPGNPTVLNTNLTGAGTLIAANYMYNQAEADGTSMGMFTVEAAIEPLLGNQAAQFDPTKFSWIGSISRDEQFCAVKAEGDGPKTFDEILKNEVLFGTSAPASDTYRQTAILKNVLGAKIKLVSGYHGMPGVLLALERGEVNGACGITSGALETNLAAEYKAGKLKLVLQTSGDPTKEFGDVPSVFDYAKTDDQRELLKFFFNSMAMGRPITAPPAIPADRLEALRTAFMKSVQDEKFLSDAKRLHVEVKPLSGEQIEQRMQEIANHSPEFFERVKEAYK